ncbi:hypothetical protein DL93DRAFT_2083000 [Clavulina sp. PMI_390]|nr:hypothetical protein DL93DRAFT_2083000 [Clavulina sp. PMI_390]
MSAPAETTPAPAVEEPKVEVAAPAEPAPEVKTEEAPAAEPAVEITPAAEPAPEAAAEEAPAATEETPVRTLDFIRHSVSQLTFHVPLFPYP